MENNSKSSVVYQGKIPGRVKYTFAFGALGKDLIYGMIATFSMIYLQISLKLHRRLLERCSSWRRSGMRSMICSWE